MRLHATLGQWKRTFADKIKIINVNVNGFRARESQLRNYVSEQGEHCLFSFSDTRLKESIKVKNFKGYTLLRADKVYASEMATAGGVALLVPEKWTIKKIAGISSGDHCESLTSVIIPPGNNNQFLLSIVYNHPGNHLPQHFLSSVNNTTFNNKKLPCLVIGDLNCPHHAFNSRTSNEYGSRLLQLINNENFILLNDGQPTYYSSATGQPNLLDLVLSDLEMSKLVESCVTQGDIGSDHVPTVTTFKSIVEKRTRSVINIPLWASKVDEQLKSVTITDDISASINSVNDIFRECQTKCVHFFNPKHRKLPTEIRENIKHRKTLLKLKKKAGTEVAKRVIAKEYNRINHVVQQQLRDFDNANVEKLASKIGQAENLTTMWKYFNQYKKDESHATEPDSPLQCPDGTLTANNEEKCAEYARHMRSVHQTPENVLFDNQFKQEIDKSMSECSTDVSEEESIDPIQVKHFRELLSGTKTKSAPGEDGITYSVLKSCNDTSISKICDVFNVCLKKNVFPNQWKTAKVKMLLKPGKDAIWAVSYRPISLISCLGKLYEKYVCNYLLKELRRKKFFRDVQAGYLHGRSPQEHLFRLAQGITNNFKKRNCTIGLFLDVKAAFDAVWKNGAKTKIKEIGLSKQLENLLCSFLDDRSLRIFIDGVWSEIVQLEAGTPQGSCLSPIIYIIFVNGFTDGLINLLIKTSQFADDVGIWASGRSVIETMKKMQSGAGELQAWCRKWFVTLNPLKSQLICFSKCPRHAKEIEEHKPSLSLFGSNIEIVHEITFLGVIFDSRLTWEPQFRKMTEKAYKRLNVLRHLSTLWKKPNPNVMLHLYKTLVKPIFEYGSVCIANAAGVHLDKLQLIQNHALRVITKSPQYMSIKDLHDCTGEKPIKQHLITHAQNRLAAMRRNSPIIHAVLDEYEKVKHIHENLSPLDAMKSQ